VSEVTHAAERLVEYDRRTAERVLRLIAHDLGAPDRAEIDQLEAHLRHLFTGDDADKTTCEWKAGLGETERLRSLGLALAELLLNR
jgi:hypothetical protein